MILFALIILYPLWFVVIASVSNPDSILNGEVWLWPDVVDFLVTKIFNDPQSGQVIETQLFIPLWNCVKYFINNSCRLCVIKTKFTV